jgi:uncharacterized phage protein (TIGR02220 family)
MARIRTVKPELFAHEGLYEAETETGLPLRLAFIGLFTVADREGRFKWRPRTLKLTALPYDDIDFSRVLDALMTRGFVVKYATETGDEFGYIPSFLKHQVINNKESASILPDPALYPTNTGVSTRAPRVDDACPAPLNLDQGEGKGRERKGKEGKGSTPLSGQPDDCAQERGADGEQDEPGQAGLPGMDAPPEPVEPKPDVEAELIAYLNEKAGREFEPVEANRKLLRARLVEGTTPEKIRAVIDAKVAEWQDDAKMAKYLQPATLFNATKFAQYVGALGARMPTLVPMRAPRAEKFDPLAYVSQTNANPHAETGHERHADCIDVQFQEVAR